MYKYLHMYTSTYLHKHCSIAFTTLDQISQLIQVQVPAYVHMYIFKQTHTSKYCFYYTRLYITTNSSSSLYNLFILILISSLTTLLLHSNQLTDLPYNLNLLRSLTTLVIAFNKFFELPQVVKELPSLKILIASGNHIRYMTTCIVCCVCIQL